MIGKARKIIISEIKLNRKNLRVKLKVSIKIKFSKLGNCIFLFNFILIFFKESSLSSFNKEKSSRNKIN